MRVAYGKIGRSVILHPDNWGVVGGDNEPLALLVTLAERNPDVEWVVAGRHSGDPGNLPRNVTVPDWPKVKPFKPGHAAKEDAAHALYASQLALFESCDGAVLWAGQHGTSNMPIPQDRDPSLVTNPQDFAYTYAGGYINALNRTEGKFEPVWLNADPRNYLKARCLKRYPDSPILSQYNFTKKQNHWRWGDMRDPTEVGAQRAEWTKGKPGFWTTHYDHAYAGLELTGVPRWEDADWPGWEERESFGIIVNEARSYVNPLKARANIVAEWAVPLYPAFIHGTWSEAGLQRLQQMNPSLEMPEPLHYTQLHTVASRAKSTMTTPSSGSEWATAKPWEMFALGVICFFHPFYDTQGHIIPTVEQAASLDDLELAHLAAWLRPNSPQELRDRVQAVDESRETYEWLRQAQLNVLRRAREKNLCVTTIEDRLGLNVVP